MKFLFIFIFTICNVVNAQEKILVPTDEFGKPQHNRQRYVIKDNYICPIDMFGKIQYHKGCIKIKK